MKIPKIVDGLRKSNRKSRHSRVHIQQPQHSKDVDRNESQYRPYPLPQSSRCARYPFSPDEYRKRYGRSVELWTGSMERDAGQLLERRLRLDISGVNEYRTSSHGSLCTKQTSFRTQSPRCEITGLEALMIELRQCWMSWLA